MARLRVAGGGDGLHIRKLYANILNEKSRQPTKGGPTAWGLGEGLTTPHCKKTAHYEMLHRTSDFAGHCEHDDEHLGSIKGGEFLDWLSDLASQEGLWRQKLSN